LSLIDGEGRVAILYGTSPLPIPPDRNVYLSRPDYAGAHPLVVVVPGDGGVTPSVKALCRRLSRFGYAALAPDLFRGKTAGALSDAPGGRVDTDLADLVSVTRDEWSHWCGSQRFVALGLGTGVPAAVRLGSGDGGGVAISPASFDGLVDALVASPAPLLALVGGMTGPEVHAARDAVGRGEWVVYGSAAPDFFDDGADGYDRPSAEDAFRRLVSFLDGRLTRVEA